MWIDIDVEIIHQTNDAIFVDDGDRKDWIPKSQIENPEQFKDMVGKNVTMTIKEWIAWEKEFI